MRLVRVGDIHSVGLGKGPRVLVTPVTEVWEGGFFKKSSSTTQAFMIPPFGHSFKQKWPLLTSVTKKSYQMSINVAQK